MSLQQPPWNGLFTGWAYTADVSRKRVEKYIDKEPAQLFPDARLTCWHI